MYYFIVWNFEPIQKGNPFLLTIVQVLPDVNMESRCPCEWGLGKCAEFVFMFFFCFVYAGIHMWMWQDYGLIHSPKKIILTSLEGSLVSFQHAKSCHVFLPGLLILHMWKPLAKIFVYIILIIYPTMF
jgi:hypothetical protein